MHAVYVQADGTNDALFEMKGGKIHALSKSNTYALLAKSTSSAASLAVISGREIEASSTGNYAFSMTAAAGGKITIDTDQPQSLSLPPGLYTLIGAYEQIEMHITP